MTTGTALASAVLHRAGREQGQGSGGPERRKQVVLGLVQLIDLLSLLWSPCGRFLFFTFVFALDSFCLSVRAGKRNRKRWQKGMLQLILLGINLFLGHFYTDEWLAYSHAVWHSRRSSVKWTSVAEHHLHIWSGIFSTHFCPRRMDRRR